MKEIERRFLLTGIPDNLMHWAFKVEEVLHGYLATDTINERFSKRVNLKHRYRNPGHVRYRRNVKIGHGIRRFEFKDKISQYLFNKVWPLTEDARVHKIRHCVLQLTEDIPELKEEVDNYIWEVDNFLNRKLFLAEVELPRKKTPVVIPDWLQPFVEREVTEEKEYEGVNLAI